jgi:hypothetical protein
MLFKDLLKASSLQLREAILNSIVNQIRYPNAITHYFLTFVLRQFLEQDNEQV